MKGRIWTMTVVLAALLASRAEAQSQVVVGGLLDLAVSNIEQDHTNLNFAGTSALDDLKLRLFVDADLLAGTQVFTQVVLYGRGDIFLYGAYVRLQEPGSLPFNIHAGFIPSNVGNWGPRNYSDQNPLVGVPLVQSHHSTIVTREAQMTVADLLAKRDDRSQGGLPVIYDNCWNMGVELYGQMGDFDWSVAALSGSVTYPVRERERSVPQGSARLGWNGGPGFVAGVSGWYGPYLIPGSAAIADKDANDYQNIGGGVDLAWLFRYVDVYAEAYGSRWEHPFLPDMDAIAGYVEARYKFLPRWYVAARLDAFEPNEIRDEEGNEVKWDYPLKRAEYGIGFRATPQVIVKGIVQNDRFDGNSGLDEDHFLMQLSARF